MKINRKKKEVMVFSKEPENINIKMEEDTLKQVPKFKYTGSTFTADGKIKDDIIQRIKEVKLCLIIKSNYFVRIILVWK
jgi:hypothetical protein